MEFGLKLIHIMAPYELTAARVLATYLIPGCVGRGVRLGSESSSGAGAGAGGVWKSGKLEVWESGNLEIWGPRNPEIWRSGDLEIHKFGVQKIKKITFSKLKSVLPKMSATSRLVVKKSSWPYLGPSEAIFSIGRKNPKNAQKLPILLGGPMGPCSPGLGPCCYPPWVGE